MKGKMGVLDVRKFDVNEKGTTSIKTVVARCNKSCIDCLSCSHKNPQANLLLASLFNKGTDLEHTKGRDVNGLCNLK